MGSRDGEEGEGEGKGKGEGHCVHALFPVVPLFHHSVRGACTRERVCAQI
jgi:hypothetical protein